MCRVIDCTGIWCGKLSNRFGICVADSIEEEYHLYYINARFRKGLKIVYRWESSAQVLEVVGCYKAGFHHITRSESLPWVDVHVLSSLAAILLLSLFGEVLFLPVWRLRYIYSRRKSCVTWWLQHGAESMWQFHNFRWWWMLADHPHLVGRSGKKWRLQRSTTIQTGCLPA